jgi:hypothetical protein
MRTTPTLLLASVLLATLAACSAIGPDYQRPVMADLPANWQGSGNWHTASPADQQAKQPGGCSLAMPRSTGWKPTASPAMPR